LFFLGQSRSDAARHVKDGSSLMSGPLAILALLALVAGWGTEHYFAELFPAIPHLGHGVVVPILAILAFLAGTAGAYVIYNGQVRDPIVVRAFKRKFYVDDVYTVLVAWTQDLLARFLAWFDKWIVDGVCVRGLSGAAWGFGFVLRFLQFGNLQGYAFIFGFGVVALIYFLLFAK
jgi:NADH-quinone oxidoreductase subunit L